MKIGRYLIERLTEKSTLVTIVSIFVGALGYKMVPESQNVITGALVSVLSAVGILTKERKF